MAYSQITRPKQPFGSNNINAYSATRDIQQYVASLQVSKGNGGYNKQRLLVHNSLGLDKSMLHMLACF